MASASEEQQIELELAQKIEQAKNEERKKNEETFGQYAKKLEELRIAKTFEAQAEADKKRIELRKKRFNQELDAEIAALRRQEEFETQQNQKKIDAELKAFREVESSKNEIKYQTDLLNIQMQLIGATEKEKNIAEEKLKIEKEIASWKRSEEYGLLSDKDKAFYEEQKRQMSQAKIANMELAESLKHVQGMYDAVWSNMSSAIESFVRTGKFSIKDFTRSVIQDMLVMQMKLQAMTLIRGLLGSVFSSGIGITAGDSPLSATGADIMGRRAAGGPVAGGSTYLVGEKGPELFMPSGSGTINPNNSLAGGGTTNVTNNYINAIDTKSFEQRLLESNQAIWSANQYANKSLASNGRRA